MSNATPSMKIGPGTKFNSPIADSNPEWEITRSRGRGVWEAKCLGEDYRGEIRVFTTEEVRHRTGFQRALKRTIDESEAWYESLTLGQTIHYDNGFENWVRCVVVMGSTVHNKIPHKCLKPVALAGNWSKGDLPRRRADGTVDMGYHAKQIASGECFEPHFGSIFESGRSRAKSDPSKLPALDLSVPELNADEAAKAKLWTAVRAAEAALASEDDFNRGPRERLEAAMKVIQGAL